MGRLHLFELEDQPWLPDVIRDAGTAYLEFAAKIAGHGEVIAPLLSRALREGQADKIVDLCSGGAGPLPAALSALEQAEGRVVRATLTDLYPNRKAFEKAKANPVIDARLEPIDATAVPADLEGLRTLFSALHHFRPPAAREILGAAARDGAPLLAVEVVARHPLALLGMLFAPIMALFTIPFLRPFRWQWIPLTYLLPVIPLFIAWDGFVSCLRCYSQEELRDLTADLASSDYAWEVGGITLPRTPFEGTYLIGTPRTG